MGLRVSYGAFEGPYSSFNRMRDAIVEATGLKINWDDYEIKNFFGNWDELPQDPLVVLIVHADHEGYIPAEVVTPLADRLEALLSELDPGEYSHEYQFSPRGRTEDFILGCRRAANSHHGLRFS